MNVRHPLLRSLALALLASAAPARPADPPAPAATAEPVLAVPPKLKALVPAEVPPGTAFPAQEVVLVLAIDVAATGAVEAVRVEQGAGEPFDSAALAAARSFEFEPGRLSTGEAVPVTVTFRLRIAAPPPPSAAPPQPPPVHFAGRLLERGTRTPLPGVAVAVRAGEEPLRDTTDAQGRFALDVPAASFTVVAAPAGHERLEVRVEARPGEKREETYYLEATGEAGVTVVRGERVQREVTREVIPADELALLPGTQGDPLKAVLNLPGASRTAFGLGELILRGSAPGDSGAFVEGLQIPILYHFGGLRSTFAPRFIEELDFIPGNFPPYYGRLIGGIVSVKVRDPKKDLLHGEADLNLYDAGVAVEGPLGGAWSGGAGFRRSWVDIILPAVLPKDAPLSFTTAPRFYDYQFLGTWDPGGADKARFLFFGSQDKLVAIFKRPANDPSITGGLQTLVAFHRLQAAWSHAFSPSLRHESFVALGVNRYDVQVGPELFFKLSAPSIDIRSTWTWLADRRVQLRSGLDLQVSRYDISLNLPRQPQEGQPSVPVSTLPRVATSQTGTLWSPALFAELLLEPRDGLTLLPSLRLDYASAIDRASLDPRFTARWRVAGTTVLKGAVGVYQQPPDPGQSAKQIGSPNLAPERSLQYSAGVEQVLREGVDLDLTGFYKALSRLVVQNPVQNVDPSAPAYVNDGTGRIYGLELLLRARFGERFFGWIAYTFQRSYRTDHPGEPERLFDFDQPNLLTVVASWQRNPRWTYGARFRVVSGNPYTPVNGSTYDAPGDVYVPLYGPTNSARLETFYALDLRVDRNWTFNRWRFSAYLDVQNVTNHGNQEGWQYSFDYRQRTKLTGLPILPILGVKGEW